MSDTTLKLLACCGAAGSGKDTVAAFLRETGKWARVSFAAPIKQGLAVMLNIPLEDIENPSLKNEPNYKFGKSIRYMLQTLGTEWGRNLVSDSIWLDLAKERIEHQFSLGYNVVVTDLRFLNEANLIKDLGGKILKIERPGNDYTVKVADNGAAQHSSEAGLPLEFIDYILYNNSTLEDLKTTLFSSILK